MNYSHTAFNAVSASSIMPHYDVLLEQMDRTGWPTSMKTDVTEYDRKALESRVPSKPFAWMLHSSGTYLVFPSPKPIDGAGHYAHEMPGFVRDSFGEDTLWFWWDGVWLHQLHCASCLAERLEAAGER